MTGSVVIIRHPRERLSKCSLRHLHDHPSFAFHKAVKGFTFDASGHVELAVDAPLLTVARRPRRWQAYPVVEQLCFL